MQLGKNVLKITAVTCIFSLSGCASLTSGPQQGFILTVNNDRNASQTVCTAENDKGVTSLTPGKVGKVYRSRQPLHVECFNSTQFGAFDVPARRRNVTKLFNFFVDFCTITCLIDRKTSKGYGYTNRQTVYLIDTNGKSSKQ